MKHLVEQIYNFFKQNIELEKKVTLYDFLKTIPGFEIQTPDSSSMVSMNMDIANNISSLCKKMASQDMLLIPIKTNPTIFLNDEYLSIGEVNYTDPIEFIRDLKYGKIAFDRLYGLCLLCQAVFKLGLLHHLFHALCMDGGDRQEEKR